MVVQFKAVPPQGSKRTRSGRKFWIVIAAVLLVPVLGAGCADMRYYLQSVSGHLQMMHDARPLEQWLADEQAPPALKQRLALARKIRRFAVTELDLPDNASYHRYADLQRRAVVWNVAAAPELSLKLHHWCFAVLGCVGYRGYFSETAARAEAKTLAAQGLEVWVYGVPAYSTLGWLNWAGGDPLLNTFIHYPDGELARLIFHELAHQVLYLKDDTLFNESFASAVERLGGAQWLAREASPAARQAYVEFDARRQQFRLLSLSTRLALADIYARDDDADHDKAALLVMKNRVVQDFRTRYAQLRSAWNGYRGYDAWVAAANNAAFGTQAAYDQLVPGFEALFAREGRDWSRFYDAVRRLAQLPEHERTRILQQLATEHTSG